MAYNVFFQINSKFPNYEPEMQTSKHYYHLKLGEEPQKQHMEAEVSVSFHRNFFGLLTAPQYFISKKRDKKVESHAQ